MQDDIADKIVVDPDRGFVMAFFNSLNIEKLDIKSLHRYVPGAIFGPLQSPDGYDCEILADMDAQRMILMRGVHPDGHVIIRSEFRPIELSLFFKDAPVEVREQINQVLKGHLPKLTRLSEAWANSDFSRAWTEGDESVELFETSRKILEALPVLDISRKANFSSNDAFNILQGECGVTKHDANYPVLASSGAGPCVILSVYNEQARQGFLSHIDDAIDLDEISTRVFDMRENSDQPLVAHMAGGWSSTYNMVADVALRLQEQPNVRIEGWRAADNVMINLALDSRDGGLYQHFDSDQVSNGPDFERRTKYLEGIAAVGCGGMARPPVCAYHHKR